MVGDKVYFYNVNSYDHGQIEDQDKFEGFQLYYRRNPARKGGCSGLRNDCLFNCIKAVLHDEMPWVYPASFKKFLKLERNDMVDISMLPMIEKKLNSFRINVSGDHTYTSTMKCQRLINLKLSNSHFKLVTITGALKIKGLAFEDKIPLFYDNYDSINNTYSIDNGKQVLSTEQFQKIKSKPITSKYILIRTDKNFKGTLKEEHDQFIHDADILKSKTDGLINLYRTGSNRKAALNLFNHFQKSIVAEPIRQTESSWISAASYAAIIFADKYEGPAYQYDVCSHYPSSMSNKFMLFPTKEGTFDNITDDKIVFRNPYGIYRCIITLSDDIHTNKLFRLNPRNYYTHIDLQCAYELKLKVTMIQDGQPNQLYYKRDDLVTGRQLFGQYFDYMFKLKEQKIPRAKEIINVLWGGLSEKHILEKTIDVDSITPMIIPENHNIDTITQVNETKFLVKYYENDSFYVTNFARIAPFILSRGRERITFLMKPYIHHVVRSHTDSLYTDIPINIVTGNKMGDVKYVGHCAHVKIHNNVHVDGEFK